MRKNVAGQKIGAQMITASDGSAFTSAVTVYVTGDAGTQAAGSVGSGACTHEGNGYHTYAPADSETNYTLVAFTFTGSGAIPATVQVYTSVDANLDTIKTQTVTCAAGVTVLASVGTAATSTAQTGDSYAIVNGDHGLVSIQDDIDEILTDTGTTLQGELDGIQTDTEDIQARLPAALVSGRIDASVGAMASGVVTATAIATNAIDADALAADAVDEILDEAVEGSYTLRHMIRLMGAALLGEVSGAGTTEVTFRDAADAKTRIVATVDADGNRSAVTLTET